MSKAKASVKKMALPDAPKPTKPFHYVDPREKERQQRLAEHKNLNLIGITKSSPLCFWDKARQARLRRLWEDGWQVKHIARECGCTESVCRDRIRYEIKCGRLEKRRQETTEEQVQSMISRYEAGMSLNMIAKEMMMSRKKVTMILEERGVKKQ